MRHCYACGKDVKDEIWDEHCTKLCTHDQIPAPKRRWLGFTVVMVVSVSLLAWTIALVLATFTLATLHGLQ